MNFIECFQQQRFVDCIISLDGEQENIYCHRIILSQNKYFYHRLLSQIDHHEEPNNLKKCISNKVHIHIISPLDPNFSFHHVKKIIFYIYLRVSFMKPLALLSISQVGEEEENSCLLSRSAQDNVRNIHNHVSSFKIENYKDALSLLSTSCYFMEFDLVDYSLDYLINSINKNNVPDILNWLIDYDYGEKYTGTLFEKVYEYLCIHYEKIWDIMIARSHQDTMIEVIRSDKNFVRNEFERYLYLVEKLFCLSRDETQIPRSLNINLDQKEQLEECFTIEEKLRILKSSIYYHHMSYEQLEHIKQHNVLPTTWLEQVIWDQISFVRLITEAKDERVFSKSSIDQLQKQQNVLIYDHHNGKNDNVLAFQDENELISLFNSSMDTLVQCQYDESKSGTLPEVFDVPFRMGFEFENKNGVLISGSRVYSNIFFYGGSQWTIELQKMLFENQYVMGVSIRRWIPELEDDQEDDLKTPVLNDIPPFIDHRKAIDCSIKLNLIVDQKMHTFGPKDELFFHKDERGWLSKELYETLLNKKGTQIIQGMVILKLN